MVAVLVATLALSAAPVSYSKAWKQAQAQNRPLLVLVGATWCPNCQVMKQVMPQVDIADCLFAYVDYDAERRIAEKLLSSDTVPELVLFIKENGEWRQERLIGSHSVAEIEEFLGTDVK